MSPLSRRELLKASAAAATLTAVAGPSALAKPKGLGNPKQAPIDTIVVVMMENRSYDHFLGWLPGGQQAGLTYLDSAGAPHTTKHWAPDYKGCGFADPGHG